MVVREQHDALTLVIMAEALDHLPLVCFQCEDSHREQSRTFLVPRGMAEPKFRTKMVGLSFACKPCFPYTLRHGLIV